MVTSIGASPWSARASATVRLTTLKYRSTSSGPPHPVSTRMTPSWSCRMTYPCTGHSWVVTTRWPRSRRLISMPCSFRCGRSGRDPSPQQDPLERVEVRPLIAERHVQPLAVACDELRIHRLRHARLVIGQERAADPLHDGIGRLEHVAVHLQAHRLRDEPELVEQRRILLGPQHRERPNVSPHRAGERLLAS